MTTRTPRCCTLRTDTMNTTTTAKAADIKKGEYVMRKPDSKKVYMRGDYDRASKKYELLDCSDINRSIFVSGKTELVIGFTY